MVAEQGLNAVRRLHERTIRGIGCIIADPREVERRDGKLWAGPLPVDLIYKRALVSELIEWFIGDVIDELGSRAEVEYAYKITDEGSSADRQFATFEQTEALRSIVDQLIQETEEGICRD